MSNFTERLNSMSPERRNYTLRALTAHLEESSEDDRLHRLLREYDCVEETVLARQAGGRLKALLVRQRSSTRVRCINSWFSLQEQEGEAAAFITDVNRGRRLAETSSSEEIGRGEKVRSIAFEARYALILSSINDLGSGIAPPLIARLIRAGIWSLTQGLAYARQVPVRSRRALALAAVAEQASGYVKHEILEQALATVLAIKDAGKRTEALVNLVSHLCGTLLQQALAAARALDYAPHRVRALIALVPHLPTLLRDEVLKEASLGVQEIDDEHTRVENLNSLAAYLPTPDREEAMRQVLAKIRALPHDFFKVGLIEAAAKHLPEPLLREADNVARGIRMDLDRGNALLALAPLLAESGRQTEALQLVQREGRHGSDHAQAQALRRMAPYLNEEHLRQALKIAGKLYVAEYRAEAVAGLGPYLSAKLLPMAFSIVGSMKHAVHQVEPLAILVRKLPEVKRKEQFERVMITAIREYDSHSARSEALARLAPNLPEELLRLALSESRRIDDEKRQVKSLTVMAAVLRPEQKADTSRRALSKAQGIDSGRDRFEALVYLTPLVAETAGVEEALGVVSSIEHPDHWARALSGVLPHLSQAKRDELLLGALQRWRKTRHDEMLPEAFNHLAPYLSDFLWPKAVSFAQAKEWASCRGGILSSLMRHAENAERLHIVLPLVLGITEERTRSTALTEAARQLARLGRHEEALGLAQTMADEVRTVDAFEAIIPYLTKPFLLQVLTSVEELTFDGRRWSVLADLAPRFAALGEWDAAVELMKSIKMFNRHALAAARMVEHAPASERDRVVEHALTIVRNAQGEFEESEDWWQGETLVRLAPYIPEAKLEGTLELVLNISDPVAREDVLSAIATKLTRLHPSDTYRMWAKALNRSSDVSRADLLANLQALMPVITYLGGVETVWEIVQAIDDVGQWWPA